MSVPNDISRTVEKLLLLYAYVIGAISLIVNTVTLLIIVRKSSALTREIKALAIFQQLSCLLSNSFFALLFIPLFYLRLGGGYCMGVLCLFVPFQYLQMIGVFLMICMFTAFGMMIVARHQLLITDNSVLKMRKSTKYVSYCIMNTVMHIQTLTAILELPSNRSKQNLVLDDNPQIRWRERGRNWFLFYGPQFRALMDFTNYAGFVQIAVFIITIILPFAHMISIVLQHRKAIHSCKRDKDVNMTHAQTILIQGFVLLVFVVFPLIPGILSIRRNDVYRDSQTVCVIAEMIFGCSTLINSFVIVSRNRNYRAAFIDSAITTLMNTGATIIPLPIYAIYVPTLSTIYLTQAIIVIVNKRKPQFRSSYFSLFIIEAFTGLTTTIMNTICFRLPVFPELYAFYVNFPTNAVTSGLYFSSFYFPACQEYVNIFIALNRLSALLFYEKYERIWRLLGRLCLPIIFGLPVISYYHFLDTAALFRTINNGTAFFIDYDHSVRPWRSNRASSFYLYLVCSITTLVINLISIIVIRCMSMAKVSSIEFRLFLLGFFSFACGLPMTAQQLVYMFTKVEAELTAMNYRLPWLYDQALSPGILSLIFSSAIRNELVQTLKPRRTTSVSGII